MMKITIPLSADAYVSSSMARVPTSVTGLPTPIAILVQPDAKHKVPHIKVSVDSKPVTNEKGSSFVLSIEDIPKVLAGPKVLETSLLHKAQEFVQLNKKLLQDYYFLKIDDTRKMLDRIKNVKTKLSEIDRRKLKDKK